MNTLVLLTIVSLTPFAHAIVDMKSSNYSEGQNDITVPGIGYDLTLNRNYSSRSLYNGLFGYGMCTPFETTVQVNAESNLKLTECGGGMEIIFSPRGFKPAVIENTVKQILVELKKRRPELRPDYVANLEKDLKTDDYLREEFTKRMGIKGKVDGGTQYLANGREAENITIVNNQYKRTMPDGTYQLFDMSGRLVQMYDKNQNYLKLTYDKTVLTQISDNLGRKLTFKYDQTTKKIAQVVGPNNLTAKYTFKGDDLTDVVDAKGEHYHYAYDDVHNMTRQDYPDKTYTALTYNKDKDWVLSFRNRKGCLETYDYQLSKDDPKNHFWSDVVKKCGQKVTNKSRYEFFHKPRPEGPGVYLYRVRTDVNGAVTDIVYHETFGKPISILKDSQKIDYTYFENGFVKTKHESGRTLAFEYKNSCNKVSQVTTQYGEDPESKERKPSQAKAAKVARTKFVYEPQKCNLVSADSSEGLIVKLEYDPKGRISQITDQTKKLVKIRYESKFGKPAFVTRPGLGTLQVTYQEDGEIAKVESKEGPNVAVQVASIFNNLLDIIAPATGETPI